jgi:hypothetical protein
LERKWLKIRAECFLSKAMMGRGLSIFSCVNSLKKKGQNVGRKGIPAEIWQEVYKGILLQVE